MPRSDDAWAELERERAIWEAQGANAVKLFDVTGLICVTDSDGREVFLMLHPSTVDPGGWQVSYFDRRGPYGHETGRNREEAIARALEYRDLSNVAVVTEREFMGISATSEFAEGVKRVRFVGLDNRLRCEFGYTDEVMAICTAAREVDDLDEAIEILWEGLKKLQRQSRLDR